MKLRVKIKDLSMSLNLTLEDSEATVQGVKQRIVAEVLQRIGLRITHFALSLNGCDPLSASVQESSLPDLGVVGGDLLHVLAAQFDPSLTRRVPEVVHRPKSLRVERSAGAGASTGQPPPVAEPCPTESGEPLLVRHSQPGRVPRLLAWLAEQAPPDGPDHLLALALHALMLEAGLQPNQPPPQQDAGGGSFRPSVAPTAAGLPPPATLSISDTVESAELFSSAATAAAAAAGAVTVGYFPGGAATAGARRWHLPDSWKRPGLFQISYGLHFNMALSAVLTIVPLGNVTVVHAVPVGGECIFTVRLRPRDYVANTESADTADRYHNLRRLSNVFKNGVTVPLLVHLQRSVGLVSPHEWRALPLELQLLILRRLSVRDLLRMRSTSREMRLRADDPLLWKDLVWRDFPTDGQRMAALGPYADWKQLYVQLFRQRAAAEQQTDNTLPAYLSQPWLEEPGSLLMVPPISGIIGGEYDRLPSLGFSPPLALPGSRLNSMLPPFQRQPSIRRGGSRLL